MEGLFEFTQNICTFMLIMTLLMNLFPHSYNKKYVKLFAGFLLICLIFNPIVNWKKSKFKIEDIIGEYTHGNFEINLNSNLEELESKFKIRLEEDIDGF